MNAPCMDTAGVVIIGMVRNSLTERPCLTNTAHKPSRRQTPVSGQPR